MMRIAYTLCALIWHCAAAAVIVETPEQRHALLADGQAKLRLEEIKKESGCMPGGCATFADGLVIMRDRGSIRGTQGRRLKLRSFAGNAPEMDWEPFGSYRVFDGAKHWGTCLEFSHAGLGKSGTGQRWRSVVLVPRQARMAYRFVGYWIGCDDLLAGNQPGEVVLAQIAMTDSRDGEPAVSIVRQHCGLRACKTVVDTRPLRFLPDRSDSALQVGE